ncbi:hypothetical protein M5K25_019677 [Dendrobium thyrsiflorum]|uniref:Uncharacterized protein n=1 Tax=Dendrobium thyrsiflorum TaxID=117978 RepID=A0ABD0UFS8_DENTH
MLMEAKTHIAVVHVEVEDVTNRCGGPTPSFVVRRVSTIDFSIAVEADFRGHLSLCEHPTFLQQKTRSRASCSSQPSGSPERDIPILSFEHYHTEIWCHEFIQEDARQNRDGLEAMFINSEFVEAAHTIEQWDAIEDYDAPLVNLVASKNAVIPTELYEVQIFNTKEDLHTAINRWSIVQNVQYVKSTSTRTRLTIMCAQHDNSYRPCLLRLHVAQIK